MTPSVTHKLFEAPDEVAEEWVRQRPPVSLEYIAGVFDACGQLIVMKGSRGHPTPVIEIRRNTPELLEQISSRFGGNMVWYEKRKWYYWKRVGKAAQAVLRELRPHLIVRAAQADRLLRVKVGSVGGDRTKGKVLSWDSMFTGTAA